MKSKAYSKFFLRTSLQKSLVIKKVNAHFKLYVCGSRAFGNLTLDYLAFTMLFRKIMLFIQVSVRAKTPLVFFFKNIAAISLYEVLAQACNEFLCFIPKAYTWVYDWRPQQVAQASLGTQCLPVLLNSGIALFSTPITSTPLLKKLTGDGWPVVAPISMSDEQLSCGFFKEAILYPIPSSSYTTIKEQYFYAAFFSKVIIGEKIRNL